MKKREKRACDNCGRIFETINESDCESCQHRKYLAVWERQVYAPQVLQGAISKIILGCLVLCLLAGPVMAQEAINVEKLATAIKIAENSPNKPYGVLLKGCDAKHEAFCRKVCINTIKHRLKDYQDEDDETDFISYLARFYAPVNSDTDNGTNQFWPKNVRYFYNEVL